MRTECGNVCGSQDLQTHFFSYGLLSSGSIEYIVLCGTKGLVHKAGTKAQAHPQAPTRHSYNVQEKYNLQLLF